MKIQNDHQLELSQNALRGLKQSLEVIAHYQPESENNKIRIKAFRSQVLSQIEKLKDEIEEYTAMIREE